MIKTVRAQINGTWYNLTKNSTIGKYEATISAPNKSSYPLSGHYYPVTVEATDSADNSTTINADDPEFGIHMRLVVKEKVAPVISVITPTDGSVLTTNKPGILWSVTDNDSGINISTITCSIDGQAVPAESISKTAIEGGYECEIELTTGLDDGEHMFIFGVSDNDGNAAGAVTSTIKIDTVPPTLSITEPDNGFATNAETVQIVGVTNDETSSPVSITIKVDGAETAIQAVVADDGTFSVSVPIEAEGEHTITIIATDAAGKTTEVTRTVLIDRTAPTITAVSLTPNPVDAGATYIVSVTVTEA